MMDHYTSFFNLKENPFALTPDPKYLFMGEKHKEVMGHLLYGVKDDKGFMVVVGEVGTGKTTLCRAFINQLLKERIEVGLIYNPAMTDLELLQAINREFNIPSEWADSKGKLIDRLNEFLLKIHGEGRKVVLIIDEAQNLYTSVMEQLRLISNLETETGKLIQIILVGQPELERILSREEMRQLDQRIVVRGLLGPLKLRETNDYIRHRLKVASIPATDPPVTFSDQACKAIHKISGGIPRPINVLADRTLLVAYAHGKRHIDKGMVKSAYRDLERHRYPTKSSSRSFRWQTAAIFCLFILVLVGWYYQGNPKKTAPEPSIPRPIKKAVIVPPPRLAGVPGNAPKPETQQEKISDKNKVEESSEMIVSRLFASLQGVSKEGNWILALNRMFELWKEPLAIPPSVTIGTLPNDTRLNIKEVYGNRAVLKSFNYPAIVELKKPNQEFSIFSVLRRLGSNKVTLLGEREEVLPLEVFDVLWSGHGYIIWKDFEDLPKYINPGSSPVTVTWLQQNLKYLGLYQGSGDGFYDNATRDAVVRFQREKNLTVDGMAGPQTKMMLYGILDIYPKPLLSEPEVTGNIDQ